jgi:dTMP kinase
MSSGGQPLFLVLEGLDGAGTTTQTGLVADELRRRGIAVCTTAEPSDGPLGDVARAHVRGDVSLGPVATTMAFLGDRSDHLARVVLPALARGQWVICDRYLLSTLGYQGAEGVDRLWVLEASGPLAVPDLTVVLEVPDAERRRRMASRPAADRYEADELQERLRRSYAESIELLRSRGHAIAVVDGGGGQDAVTARILAELDALM